MTGLVLLAAGSSTRLGEAKQKLQYQGKSLLQRATQTAIESGCKPLVVVLGSGYETMLHEIGNQQVLTIYNPDWEQGMASSIRTGLNEALKAEPAIESIIIMLCDQPFVHAELLKSLMEHKRSTGINIVACAYNNTLGAPVWFSKKMFSEVLSLQGQEGAKKLLSKHKDEVLSVSFELGSIDIDTQEDHKLLSPNS